MSKDDYAKGQQKNNVRALQNDYVLSNPQQRSKKKERQKVLMQRRLLVFSVFATIVLFSLVRTIVHQNERLSEKEALKEDVIAQLEEAKGTQEMLKLQIAKLEDDEYIAKLARKEYFLSEEGEIIFTIPTEQLNKAENE